MPPGLGDRVPQRPWPRPPQRAPRDILGARPYRWIYLIAMISFFDCAAVAAWHDGQLRRSLSVTFHGQLADPPVTGEIVENIGDPLPFEQPLWARHSPHGEQPILFHPLDLGEAALAAILGLPYAGPCLTQSNTAPSPWPGSASPPCPARRPKNAKPKQQHGAPCPRSDEPGVAGSKLPPMDQHSGRAPTEQTDDRRRTRGG
jgi:Family of unknown function (DUF6928)